MLHILLYRFSVSEPSVSFSYLGVNNTLPFSNLCGYKLDAELCKTVFFFMDSPVHIELWHALDLNTQCSWSKGTTNILKKKSGEVDGEEICFLQIKAQLFAYLTVLDYRKWIMSCKNNLELHVPHICTLSSCDQVNAGLVLFLFTTKKIDGVCMGTDYMRYLSRPFLFCFAISCLMVLRLKAYFLMPSIRSFTL